MVGSKPKVVVVTGPTASGKSTLAVDLALRFEGEVVSADSMQVYRGMDVATAKTPVSERQGIPHHMLDVIDPDQEFNAAIYRSMAAPLVSEITARGKVCLVVGGTGLYIKALLGGLFECPSADAAFRARLQKQCERYGSVFLYRELQKLDPTYADRVHPNDRLRIIRALEVIHRTRTPMSRLIREHRFRDRSFQSFMIGLQWEREGLYQRINDRCLAMIAGGLMAETEVLLKKGYTTDLKPMQALGYRHMVNVLKGVWTMEEATRSLQTDTRRYAKRQLTWFRAEHEMNWFSPEDQEGITRRVEGFLSGRGKPDVVIDRNDGSRPW
jgi:tRNA dimethylallyltransferase